VTKRVEISMLQGIGDLLSLLEADPEIILTNAQTPIAKLASINHAPIPEHGRVPDMHADIWVGDDFDEAVPDEYWNTRTL
jgi:hypothetical protein